MESRPTKAGHALRRRVILAFCLCLVLLLGGCTDVRPTVKIGLLAPFEGLERRSGYASLEAVRAAIAEFPATEVGILPLALDAGSTPEAAQRAAQKLLADPRVKAIVGPLDPAASAAVAAVLPADHPAWLPGYLPPGMSVEQWAQGLARTIGDLARRQGAQTLVIAGDPAGWPTWDAAGWQAAAGLPVRLDDDPAAVTANQAVFWLGSAAGGADYLARLRERLPAVPFWLGPQGDDPVFAERAGALDFAYWANWTDAGYTSWAETYASPSPAAYVAYAATHAALEAATGQPASAAPAPAAPSWFVQAFAFGPQGERTPYEP